MKKILYVYIKGHTYTDNLVEREADKEFNEIVKYFDKYDDMINWVTTFSNNYSIPVQFYK